MSERPEFEYYMGIANQPLPILGGEDSLKSELSDLVEESIYCIEDLETEIQTLKEKVRELEEAFFEAHSLLQIGQKHRDTEWEVDKSVWLKTWEHMLLFVCHS